MNIWTVEKKEDKSSDEEFALCIRSFFFFNIGVFFSYDVFPLCSQETCENEWTRRVCVSTIMFNDEARYIWFPRKICMKQVLVCPIVVELDSWKNGKEWSWKQ